MNNTEAIETLQDMKGVFGNRGHEQHSLLALDLAISALEKQLSLKELGFTDEIIGNYKKFEDECIAKGFTLKSLIEARDKQINSDWIPTSERLPQLPDGKSFISLNATILAPSGLRNTVQMTWELKRGKPTWCYLGGTSDWNVIAWQSLPEPYKEG